MSVAWYAHIWIKITRYSMYVLYMYCKNETERDQCSYMYFVDITRETERKEHWPPSNVNVVVILWIKIIYRQWWLCLTINYIARLHMYIHCTHTHTQTHTIKELTSVLEALRFMTAAWVSYSGLLTRNDYQRIGVIMYL